MDVQSLTLPFAFLAGLLSFVSPCVLPLVPAYMGYLGGTALTPADNVAARREMFRTLFHAALFVLGFTFVFVLLGASASLIGRWLFDFKVVLQRVGGVLLLTFGMRLMGANWSRRRWLGAGAVGALLTFLVEALGAGVLAQGSLAFSADAWVWGVESVMLGWVIVAGADLSLSTQIALAAGAGGLNYLASTDLPAPNAVASLLIALLVVVLNRPSIFYAEKRLELKGLGPNPGSANTSGQSSYLRSLLVGIVFAAGWSPCIGPILGSILALAAQLETVGQGILLLVAYSLGLGIPFLVVGLAFGPLSKSLRKMNRYLGIVSAISGLLLALMGVLIFTDSLTFLARYGSFFTLEP